MHDPSTILLQYLNIIIINERYTHKIKKLLNLLVLDSFSFFFLRFFILAERCCVCLEGRDTIWFWRILGDIIFSKLDKRLNSNNLKKKGREQNIDGIDSFEFNTTENRSIITLAQCSWFYEKKNVHTVDDEATAKDKLRNKREKKNKQIQITNSDTLELK